MAQISPMVSMATIGRPFRILVTTARGTFSSVVCVTPVRVTTTYTAPSATSVFLFVPSKGSQNSERSELIQFFNSYEIANKRQKGRAMDKNTINDAVTMTGNGDSLLAGRILGVDEMNDNALN